ncbi:hypothetical protein MRX96_052575 [Rhipicephalus microplus]
METGNELSELLCSEADMQLLTEVPESSNATVASSTANLDQTAATGPAETATPAVESLPQCSESAPAEAGATAAQPAASKKRIRAGPDSAIMEMVKEQKMFRGMWQECKAREFELQNEQLKLQKEAAKREEKLIDILQKFLE